MIHTWKTDWLMFRLFGLFPEQAEALARWLPVGLAVLTVILATVWFFRYGTRMSAVAGYGAVLTLVLAAETMMFTPITTWLLLGSHRPDFFWVLHKYPRECFALVVGFPVVHLLAFSAYRAEIETWFSSYRW